MEAFACRSKGLASTRRIASREVCVENAIAFRIFVK